MTARQNIDPGIFAQYAKLPSTLAAIQRARSEGVKPVQQGNVAQHVAATQGEATQGATEMPEGLKLQGLDNIPNRDEYSYAQDFVKQYVEPAMTPEEQEARAKASSATSSVGALGNALSAFSNLAFTGGVAPSQTLPEQYNPTADIKAMRDREDSKMKDYVSQILAARKFDTDEYNNAWNQREKVINSLNNKAMAEQNDAWKRADFKEKVRTGDRDYTFKKGEADKANARADAASERADKQLALSQAQFSYQKQRDKETRENQLAIAALKAGKGGNIEGVPMYIPDSNGGSVLGYVDIPMANMTTERLSYVFDMMPDDIKMKYRSQLRDAKGDPKKTATLLQSALGSLASNPEKSAELYDVMGAIGLLPQSTDAPYLNNTAGSGNDAPWLQAKTK